MSWLLPRVPQRLAAQVATRAGTALRYLSAVGDVGGGVIHVPVTGPEAKPGFLGGEPQLQQVVNFRRIDM